jgi:hypothetical protein
VNNGAAQAHMQPRAQPVMLLSEQRSLEGGLDVSQVPVAAAMPLPVRKRVRLGHSNGHDGVTALALRPCGLAQRPRSGALPSACSSCSAPCRCRSRDRHNTVRMRIPSCRCPLPLPPLPRSGPKGPQAPAAIASAAGAGGPWGRAVPREPAAAAGEAAQPCFARETPQMPVAGQGQGRAGRAMVATSVCIDEFNASTGGGVEQRLRQPLYASNDSRGRRCSGPSYVTEALFPAGRILAASKDAAGGITPPITFG